MKGYQGLPLKTISRYGNHAGVTGLMKTPVLNTVGRVVLGLVVPIPLIRAVT
jgi:hypothetical protein